MSDEFPERYLTSKCHTLTDLDSVSTFGYRGEALASLAEVAVLDLVSRAKWSSIAFAKTVRGAELLRREDAVREIGTTVTVRELFHSLPVRRHHLLANLAKETEKIRKRVERLTLLRHDVQLTLFDQAAGVK